MQNKSKDKQYTEFDYISNTKILDTKETDGLIQMLLKDIFQRIHSQGQQQTKATISYYEVYQEKIFDLLGEGERNLDVRDGPDNKTVIVNLVKKAAKNLKEALDIFAKGEGR